MCQLGRIEHMSAPNVIQRPAADEIDALGPARQEVHVADSAGPVFHVKHFGSLRNPRARKAAPASQATAAVGRRTWRRRAVNAAGVTPGIRAAAPRDPGRAAASLLRPSADRPATAP